jgi:50S ribosomal protein L16 3-hydroxylase
MYDTHRICYHCLFQFLCTLMIKLPIELDTFLKEYWQKKPLVIPQAIPHFTNPLSADELAGLALEEDVESRLVYETPGASIEWHLKRGPFHEEDFQSLPKTHWTLLVQGVDRIIPEVAQWLDEFNFIPHWRIDDVMISYAVQQGSVGPHYDNYDVFLYQAAGRRKWSLTTQNCRAENYLTGVDLRIMKQFNTEEEFILEPGDMLYLPPHVGHHGVSLSDDCMTFSFGYRSYRSQELLESFTDYLSELDGVKPLYVDPTWKHGSTPALIPPDAWKNAQQLLHSLIQNEDVVKKWFGCYVTQLDGEAEQLLQEPLLEEEMEASEFLQMLHDKEGLIRDAVCRFAYEEDNLQLFINGVAWNIEGVSPELVKHVANHRIVLARDILDFLKQPDNQQFIYELWQLQWLQWLNE